MASVHVVSSPPSPPPPLASQVAFLTSWNRQGQGEISLPTRGGRLRRFVVECRHRHCLCLQGGRHSVHQYPKAVHDNSTE